MKELMEREPLTREEVVTYLEADLTSYAKSFGAWSSLYKDKKAENDKILEKYDNGETVVVFQDYRVEQTSGGLLEFTDTLMSDGTVETACYGYMD